MLRKILFVVVVCKFQINGMGIIKIEKSSTA